VTLISCVLNLAGRRRLALWHARQLNNCSGNSICEAQHHISTYLYAKEVRSVYIFWWSVRDHEHFRLNTDATIS